MFTKVLRYNIVSITNRIQTVGADNLLIVYRFIKINILEICVVFQFILICLFLSGTNTY